MLLLLHLACGDVQAKRRRVVVLEVVEVRVACSRDLKGNGRSSGAVKRGNVVSVSRRDGDDAIVSRLGRLVVVSGALRSRRRELGKVELAVTSKGVVGCLKILLVREEEDQAALLASIRGGDVKVEDGRDGARDGTKVLRSRGRVRVGAVNGNDQVRELVRPVEVGRASLRRRRRGGRRRRWRRSTSFVASVCMKRDLAAVDALVRLVVDVDLVILASLALVKLRLAVVRHGSVAGNREARGRLLVEIALQDACRRRPPASVAIAVGEHAVGDGEGRRSHTATCTHLSTGDLAQCARGVTRSREMKLASSADGKGVGGRGREDGQERRFHHYEEPKKKR